MPTYKRPGVFINESLAPLTQALSVPGESTGAFVGVHTQGPAVPILISSWTQFVSIYGGFGNGSSQLPFAVYQYFNNGGRQAWIVRAVPSDSVAAKITLNDRTAGAAVPLLDVVAEAAGTWGNSIFLDVTDSGTGTGRFNLTIRVGGTNDSFIAERWLDISMNPVDARNAVSLLNSPVAGSNLVVLTSRLVAGTPWTVAKTPALQTLTPLTTGTDGVAVADLATATTLLERVPDMITINLPGVSDTAVLNTVLTWAASRDSVFVVVDGPPSGAAEGGTVTALVNMAPGGAGTPLQATSLCAVYGPWLIVNDPVSNVPGATRILPPGGAVIGRFVANDVSRGVQKPPAGIDIPLNGVLGVDMTFSGNNLDTLNATGINVIRVVPGAGFCVMGARTLNAGMPDRYINIRRTLQYIKKALRDGTQFAIFEPNGPELRSRIEAQVTQYLNTLLQVGVLRGSTADEGFFVVCDDTNNPPQNVAAGEIHLTVGVALSAPAEFVVISIGQYLSGSSAASDTASLHV